MLDYIVFVYKTYIKCFNFIYYQSMTQNFVIAKMAFNIIIFHTFYIFQWKLLFGMQQWKFIFKLKVVDIMVNAIHLRLIAMNPLITQTRSHNNEIRKEW